jgi:pimeloyl-ACP methyl ester carboxylesterase
MSPNETAGSPRQDRAWVTAAEWFAGGQRIAYDPAAAHVLTEEEAAATPGALRVFERVPQAEILTFPGGHLTTSEHPDLLAATIRDIAPRHGVGNPAPAHR